MAVQRLFDHPSYPHTNERDWNGAFKSDSSREIAFEIGAPYCAADAVMTADHTQEVTSFDDVRRVGDIVYRLWKIVERLEAQS
jgi:hypothetical protein